MGLNPNLRSSRFVHVCPDSMSSMVQVYRAWARHTSLLWHEDGLKHGTLSHTSEQVAKYVTYCPLLHQVAIHYQSCFMHTHWGFADVARIR